MRKMGLGERTEDYRTYSKRRADKCVEVFSPLLQAREIEPDIYYVHCEVCDRDMCPSQYHLEKHIVTKTHKEMLLNWNKTHFSSERMPDISDEVREHPVRRAPNIHIKNGNQHITLGNELMRDEGLSMKSTSTMHCKYCKKELIYGGQNLARHIGTAMHLRNKKVSLMNKTNDEKIWSEEPIPIKIEPMYPEILIRPIEPPPTQLNFFQDVSYIPDLSINPNWIDEIDPSFEC